MRINWNNKYLTIAVYALLAVTAGILVYKFLNGFTGYETIIDAAVNALKPIVYGIIIAYILSPIEKMFEYKFFPWVFKNKISEKVNRYLSITFAYLLLVITAVLVLYIAVPQLIESADKIITSIPRYIEYVQNWFNDFLDSDLGALIAKNFDLSAVDINNLMGEFQVMAESSYGAVKSTLSAFVSMVFNLILGVVISIYLLCDRETYFCQIKKVLYAFFDNKKVDRLSRACANTKEIFNNFMYSKLIGCLIVGIICYIAVLIMGVSNALLISFIIGVTNFIPYFGPFIGTVPCVVLIFFDSSHGAATNPTMAVIFIVFILILQQIDGNILGPKIQGKSVGISSFWVLISVIVFGEFFGVVGMLISVPIFAVMISVFKVFVNERLVSKAAAKENCGQNPE